MAVSVGDDTGGDGAAVTETVPVSVEGRVRSGGVGAKVGADKRESFAGAELGVCRGAVGDLLTANGILLVGERERGRGDAIKRGLVIQRGVRGEVGHVLDRIIGLLGKIHKILGKNVVFFGLGETMLGSFK